MLRYGNHAGARNSSAGPSRGRTAEPPWTMTPQPSVRHRPPLEPLDPAIPLERRSRAENAEAAEQMRRGALAGRASERFAGSRCNLKAGALESGPAAAAPCTLAEHTLAEVSMPACICCMQMMQLAASLVAGRVQLAVCSRALSDRTNTIMYISFWKSLPQQFMVMTPRWCAVGAAHVLLPPVAANRGRNRGAAVIPGWKE